MKHLKKYNESIQIDEFKEYVKDCFIEFKDDSKYNFLIETPIMTSDTSIISDNDNYLVEIEIDTHPTPLERDRKYSISGLVKFSKSLSDFYLDIENSIDKVKIKYPNIYAECEEHTYKEGNKYLIIQLKIYKWLNK